MDGETSQKLFGNRFLGQPREKICGAILSVRTLCFSIGSTLGAIGLFLPHNMATKRGQDQESKKGKKGRATLCGRTFCVIALY
jgi:hypothetical protein